MSKELNNLEFQIKNITQAHSVAGLVAVRNPTDYNMEQYKLLDNKLKKLIKNYLFMKEVDCCRELNKPLINNIVIKLKHNINILN